MAADPALKVLVGVFVVSWSIRMLTSLVQLMRGHSQLGLTDCGRFRDITQVKTDGWVVGKHKRT